jgi:hypothetical protein
MPISGARLFDVDPIAKTVIVRLRGIEHVVSVDALVKMAYSANAGVVVLPVTVGET